MIRVSEAQQEAIRRHGARTFPHECVGVILGDVQDGVKVAQELRPLENVHEEGHERRYLVSPDQMLMLMQEERRTRRKVLGFYHSHPNHPARPSDYDRDWAWPWYSYIIVSVMDGVPADMTAWQLEEDRQSFRREEIEGCE
ncbi:MAG TPA: M67 family metallopeptidase [Chthonomonadaceae bacterium]|nr:M67 family metallopeptidase [Chthonomonadaceae bacterium]